MDKAPASSLSTGNPSQTELRIRSLSTLLRWVYQQGSQGVSRKPDEDLAQFLDRVALMFVSGRPHSDVAAVVPTFDRDAGFGLAAVLTVPNYDFDGMKNLARKAGTGEERASESDDALMALRVDEVAFLVERGHDHISLDLHVQHLEFLVNQTFVGTPKPSTENLIRLQRYLYIYCAQKLRNRLSAQWPGSRLKFLDLFLESQRTTNAIPWELAQGLDLRESPEEFIDLRLEWKKEDWLQRILKKIGCTVELDLDDSPQLVLTSRVVYEIYKVVAFNLKNIHSVLAEIAPLLPAADGSRNTSQQKINKITTAFRSMTRSLALLNRLVSSSRSFWRAMYTMLPTFEKLRDLRAKQSVSGSSPSQPPKPTSTGRHTESSPKTITAAQQYQSAGPSDRDYLEEKDAEEPGDDYAFEDAASPMRKIRQWFILLTQWTQIVGELQKFLPRVCRDPQRPLRIRAGYAAQAVQPRRQASLFNTIENVLPKLPLEEKLAAIKRVISNKTIQATSPNVLRGVTDDHDPEEWQEAFEGGIHCEAQLMRDYGSNVPYRTIGISKQCCFCCEALLSSYGLSTNTHGKIYAWACPPGLPENIQKLILDRLEAQLQRFFQTVTPRTQTPESAPDTTLEDLSFVDVEEVDNYDLESDEGDVDEA